MILKIQCRDVFNECVNMFSNTDEAVKYNFGDEHSSRNLEISNRLNDLELLPNGN